MASKSSLSDVRALTSFEASINVQPNTQPYEYRALTKHARMSKNWPVAYGGYVQAWSINAAAATVPAGYGLFNFSGIFLSPVSTTEHLSLSVSDVRRTRTFHTRSVIAHQLAPTGGEKTVFTALVDFINDKEPESMNYCVPPKLQYTSAEACPKYREHLLDRVSKGTLSQELYDGFMVALSNFYQIIDQRYCPEGILFQNVFGIDSSARTTQDDKPITEKTSAYWVRSLESFSQHADGNAMHKAALTFLLDGSTSTIPLQHSLRSFLSTQACSSLDVSVRFRSSKFRMDQWILIELYTEAAGEGRTIPNAKAWTEQGELIATASQNCILRFGPGEPQVKL